MDTSYDIIQTQRYQKKKKIQKFKDETQDKYMH